MIPPCIKASDANQVYNTRELFCGRGFVNEFHKFVMCLIFWLYRLRFALVVLQIQQELEVQLN